jgi:Ca2+-binding RTX toxin-like protein
MATIYGTTGNDVYNGTGNTDDTANIDSYSLKARFSLDALGRWVVTSDAGTDTLNNIDAVQFKDALFSLSAIGGENRVVAGKKADSHVTQLTNGDVVVVWTSDASLNQDGSDSGIYMQRYSSAGALLGSETRVNEHTFGWQRQASVTALSDGNYVVVWTGPYEYQYGGTYGQYGTSFGNGLFMQMFDSAGQKIGSEKAIDSDFNANYFLRNPTVTTLADGSFIVATEKGNSASSLNQFYVNLQHFDSTGKNIGTNSTDAIGWHRLENPVFGDSTDDSMVTALNGGGYVLTWQGKGQYYNSGDYGVYVQRFDSANVKLGAVVRIDTTTTLQRSAESTALQDGGFVVTWQGTSTVQDNAHDLQGNGVYMQFFDSLGAQVGGPVLVNTTTAGHQYAGEVVTLDDGNILVTWTSEAQDGSGYGVYFQMFDYTGTRIGTETLINTTTSGNQQKPSITPLSDGGFLVAWDGNSPDGTRDGVYLQRFDANGVPLITTIGDDENYNSLQFTGTQDIRLTGKGGNDSLWSGDGNDVLDGGTGDDNMRGGAGNDTYVVDSTQDQIYETAGAGTDTVRSSVTWALAATLENLILTGDSAIDGTGNAANNIITGNNAANVLTGGAGADTMTGGGGDDTYYVDNAGDKVIETDTSLVIGGNDTVIASATHQLSANVENLRLDSANAINGKGNTLDNIIYAGAGSNVMDGGTGIDTLSYAFATAGVSVNLAVTTAQNTGGSGSDTVLGFERLTGSSYNDNLTGDAGDNVIEGGAGNDTIQGGAGNDTLKGGAGDDAYYVDGVGDTVVEAAGGGTDTVNSTLAAYTLGANVESGRILATGAANITGNALANTLYAGVGDNVLDGGSGIDTVSYADATAAVTFSLASTTAQATGGSGSDTLAGIENLAGSNYNDKLTGNAQANVLDGGTGADTLTGGLGNDTYYVDSPDDVVVEGAGGGTDTVVSTLADYVMGAEVESGRIVATGTASITGNALANLLYAGAGDNILNGGSGSDTVSYADAKAAVTVSLAITTAQATGGSGTDTLASIESLAGSNYNDRLTGNTVSNVLDGGTGADTMAGGLGNDTYYVDNAGDVVVEAAGGGTDTVNSTLAAYTLGAEVESGRILATGAANITGNALANTLYAGAGNNVLDGGSGIDTVSYADAKSAVTASLAITTAQATGGSGTDTLASIENLAGSNYNDRLTGNAQANVLNGGTGADTLAGGLGNDTYYVDNAGDVVVETAGGGTDLVNSTLAAYTLAAEVESGRIVATGTASMTGNALANTLYAGAGNNVLDGGSGTDTVSYADAKAAVTVSLAIKTAQATGGSGSDTLAGIENLAGSNYNDKLTGDTQANVLDGGLGADTMTGGLGNDTYYVDNAGDVVVEAAGGGTDTVVSTAAMYTLGAEVESGRILATGTAGMTGNALANTFYAGAGNNVLDGGGGIDTVSYSGAAAAVTVSLATATAQATGGSGTDTLVGIENLTGSNYNDRLTGDSLANLLNGGTGADTMTGGDGSDVYYVDNIGDQVVETNAASAGGNDTVNSYLAAWTLSANVENGRILSSTASNLTGNGLNNVLYAGAGNNVLNGGAGTDTVSYVYATSAVKVSLASTAAQATGGSGADTLSGFEILVGSSFNDTLTGSTGSDRLVGAAGRDTLAGNGGNDVFDLDNVSESGITSATRDVIKDFLAGDRIDLASIDAIGTTTANDAFSFIGKNAFSTTNASGQLRFAYDSAANLTIVYGSTDADVDAEFSIELTGNITLTAADFLV